MKNPGNGVLLLLTAEGVPTLAGSPLRLGAPNRPACYLLSQMSMHLVILALISRARRTPNVFVRTTWAKTRGLSEFQIHDITPLHSYQAHMLDPLPDVHAPGDPGLDLPGPADAQCLGEYDVGEDEGSLGVPTP